MTASTPDPAAIVSLTAWRAQVPVRRLLGRRVPTWCRPARLAVIWLLWTEARQPTAAIAARLGLGGCAVSHGLQEAREALRTVSPLCVLVEAVRADLTAEAAA